MRPARLLLKATRTSSITFQSHSIRLSSAPIILAARHNTTMASAPSTGNLLWIDCEMTGLNPFLRPRELPDEKQFSPDRILEIACIATNAELEPLDEGIELVVRTERQVLDAMNPWCINQHGKTGLTQACLNSTLPMTEVDELCAAYVRKHWPEGSGPALLAGSSVHADRAFINKDLPKLASTLHYRIVDVSSVKELVARWYPDVAKAPRGKDESLHRALSDIRDSIAELRYYRTHFFVASARQPNEPASSET